MAESASRPDDGLIAAVRKGCQAAEVHLTCSFPQCTCKQIPAAVHAVLSELGRNKILEEAAQVCDFRSEHWDVVSHCEGESNGAADCADHIRALKQPAERPDSTKERK